jgi:hypothetical protein
MLLAVCSSFWEQASSSEFGRSPHEHEGSTVETAHLAYCSVLTYLGATS